MTELFEPNEEELDQMIEEVKIQMDEAESQAEYNHLFDQLKDLRKQREKLIINNDKENEI